MNAVKFVDAYIRMCSQGLDCEDCPCIRAMKLTFVQRCPRKEVENPLKKQCK